MPGPHVGELREGVVAAVRSYDIGMSFLGFGFVLVLYDCAEVGLKPILGALSDHIGPKPVIVGGLLAFSSAAPASVARLAGKQGLGSYVGRLSA